MDLILIFLVSLLSWNKSFFVTGLDLSDDTEEDVYRREIPTPASPHRLEGKRVVLPINALQQIALPQEQGVESPLNLQSNIADKEKEALKRAKSLRLRISNTQPISFNGVALEAPRAITQQPLIQGQIAPLAGAPLSAPIAIDEDEVDEGIPAIKQRRGFVFKRRIIAPIGQRVKITDPQKRKVNFTRSTQAKGANRVVKGNAVLRYTTPPFPVRTKRPGQHQLLSTEQKNITVQPSQLGPARLIKAPPVVLKAKLHQVPTAQEVHQQESPIPVHPIRIARSTTQPAPILKGAPQEASTRRVEASQASRGYVPKFKQRGTVIISEEAPKPIPQSTWSLERILGIVFDAFAKSPKEINVVAPTSTALKAPALGVNVIPVPEPEVIPTKPAKAVISYKPSLKHTDLVQEAVHMAVLEKLKPTLVSIRSVQTRLPESVVQPIKFERAHKMVLHQATTRYAGLEKGTAKEVAAPAKEQVKQEFDVATWMQSLNALIAKIITPGQKDKIKSTEESANMQDLLPHESQSEIPLPSEEDNRALYYTTLGTQGEVVVSPIDQPTTADDSKAGPGVQAAHDVTSGQYTEPVSDTADKTLAQGAEVELSILSDGTGTDPTLAQVAQHDTQATGSTSTLADVEGQRTLTIDTTPPSAEQNSEGIYTPSGDAKDNTSNSGVESKESEQKKETQPGSNERHFESSEEDAEGPGYAFQEGSSDSDIESKIAMIQEGPETELKKKKKKELHESWKSDEESKTGPSLERQLRGGTHPDVSDLARNYSNSSKKRESLITSSEVEEDDLDILRQEIQIKINGLKTQIKLKILTLQSQFDALDKQIKSRLALINKSKLNQAEIDSLEKQIQYFKEKLLSIQLVKNYNQGLKSIEGQLEHRHKVIKSQIEEFNKKINEFNNHEDKTIFFDISLELNKKTLLDDLTCFEQIYADDSFHKEKQRRQQALNAIEEDDKVYENHLEGLTSQVNLKNDELTSYELSNSELKLKKSIQYIDAIANRFNNILKEKEDYIRLIDSQEKLFKKTAELRRLQEEQKEEVQDSIWLLQSIRANEEKLQNLVSRGQAYAGQIKELDKKDKSIIEEQRKLDAEIKRCTNQINTLHKHAEILSKSTKEELYSLLDNLKDRKRQALLDVDPRIWKVLSTTSRKPYYKSATLSKSYSRKSRSQLEDKYNDNGSQSNTQKLNKKSFSFRGVRPSTYNQPKVEDELY